MFQSRGGVRPERNKRSLPLREGASPRTPDDAMLVSRSSTVGQVSASEINVPFPFQVDTPVEPTLQGDGAGGAWPGDAFETSEGTFFRSGREGIAERLQAHTHPTQIYLC